MVEDLRAFVDSKLTALLNKNLITASKIHPKTIFAIGQAFVSSLSRHVSEQSFSASSLQLTCAVLSLFLPHC